MGGGGDPYFIRPLGQPHKRAGVFESGGGSINSTAVRSSFFFFFLGVGERWAGGRGRRAGVGGGGGRCGPQVITRSYSSRSCLLKSPQNEGEARRREG